jgi:ribosome maturation factor RimP
MQGGSRRGSPRANGRGAGPRATLSGPGPDPDRLTRLLDPVLRALDLDLEEIRITTAGRRRVLRIIVDADGGVSLDEIALASRELSVKLDSAPLMGDEPYTLEVSSPGVDRPLTAPRHWRRNVGRLVTATVPDGGRVEGRITSANESAVVLEQGGATREYSFADLGPGRVQVEFSRLDDELGEEDIGGH